MTSKVINTITKILNQIIKEEIHCTTVYTNFSKINGVYIDIDECVYSIFRIYSFEDNLELYTCLGFTFRISKTVDLDLLMQT